MGQRIKKYHFLLKSEVYIMNKISFGDYGVVDLNSDEMNVTNGGQAISGLIGSMLASFAIAFFKQMVTSALGILFDK